MRYRHSKASQRDSEKAVEKMEVPLPQKGYAADDTLDLIAAVKTATNGTLHPDLVDAPIRRLDEPYPTSCSARGQLETQTQLYHMCKSAFFENGEAFRVTDDDYATLIDYIDDFECWTEERETPLCMCAPGNTDFVCMTQMSQSCVVNITSPPLYEGCMDRPDSDYYMYSLGGFAPCYYYDFNEVYEFELTLQC